MNLKKLIEYGEKERLDVQAPITKLLESDKKEFDLMLQGLPPEKLTQLDLIPEYKEKLEGTTYTNWIGVNGVDQIPFFDRIVFPIYPWQTEALYKKSTGISVEDTLLLIDSGKILPILAAYPELFINIQGDYLDPLLERGFPTSYRSYPEAIYQTQQAYRIIKEMGRLRKVKTAINFEARFERKMKKEALGSLIIPQNEAKESYAKLCSLGYGGLAEKLFSLPSYLCSACCWTYAKILIDLPARALNGICSVEDNFVSALSRIDHFHTENLKLPSILTHKSFPVDVGRLLINDLELVTSREIGLHRTIEIHKEAQQCRMILLEIDKMVKNRQLGTLLDRKEALAEVWNNVQRSLATMIAGKRRLSRWIVPMSLGIMGGTAGSIASAPGILAGILGGILTSLPVAEPFAEWAIKIKRPDYLIFMYNMRTGGHKAEF